MQSLTWPYQSALKDKALLAPETRGALSCGLQAAALALRNAKYAMLSDDEEDFAPAMPAPTTAPLPKASKKNLRKAKVCTVPAWALTWATADSKGRPSSTIHSCQQP